MSNGYKSFCLKIWKYIKIENLQIEVERMWQLKTSAIPIDVGALRLVKNATAEHLEKINGKQNLAEIQKVILTSSTRILIKELSIQAIIKKISAN